jgi:hypothetical protein
MDDRIPFAVCRRLAREAGACAPAHVLSHLRWAVSETDARRSLAQLKINRPEYFGRARQGRAR